MLCILGWRIQNWIITACNSVILQCELVHDINTEKSFTVLADETSDKLANKEQLTLCVRYYV